MSAQEHIVPDSWPRARHQDSSCRCGAAVVTLVTPLWAVLALLAHGDGPVDDRAIRVFCAKSRLVPRIRVFVQTFDLPAFCHVGRGAWVTCRPRVHPYVPAV